MKSRIRKFYLHSKLNFGKYRGETISDVLSKKNGGMYLMFCQSKMPKICFDALALAEIHKAYDEERKSLEFNEIMDDLEAGWEGHKDLF